MDFHQTWYVCWCIASGTQGLPSLYNDGCRLTFDHFYGKVKLFVHKHLYGENVEKSFSQNVLHTAET